MRPTWRKLASLFPKFDTSAVFSFASVFSPFKAIPFRIHLRDVQSFCIFYI